MKFGNPSGSRNERRRRQQAYHPAAAESLEIRSLLAAGPAVLTPVEPVTVANPVISWEAVDGAVSYDLWVSDLDTRTIQFVQEDIAGTSFTPTAINQGRTRVWVRANFADDTSTDWGPNYDFLVQVVPSITGPVNTDPKGVPTKIDDTTPTITWDSAPGNWRFQIFLSNQTALTSSMHTVQNLTPILDGNGQPIPDGKGDVLRQEVRSFEVPSTLPLSQFQAFIRAIDDAGRVTAWSSPFNFEVAPKTQILRPMAPTFQNPPLLEWSPVPGATHYDVWVDGPGQPQMFRSRMNVGTSYQIPKKLADGDYTFWVRAINMTTGRPQVIGIWSDAAHFSTLRRPVVNGPVGVDHNDPNVVLVTAPNPTITWTAIDRAVRYEVWVDRTQGPAKYVHTNTSVASYSFANIIDPGNYWVWVRAFSSTGVATNWSAPYLFTATGGAPVITAPTNNSTTVALPTFTWTPVNGAASYEVWVALVDVDFDFLRVSGITDTEFTPDNPFNPGTYRVWVRAIDGNGTAHRWSEAVTFVVAEAEVPADPNSSEPLIDQLAAPQLASRVRPAKPVTPTQPIVVAEDEPTVEPPAADESRVVETPAAAARDIATDLISRIAADGVLTEWWTGSEDDAA